MEFGFFALSPQRSPEKTAPQVLSDTVAEVCLAESLGFDVAWIAEHHFSNLSLSPSPLLLAGHLAGLTRQIALGTGVVVLPLYQPMRLVEEIAYVDMLSQGRLRLGIGAGSQNHESRGLGTDVAHARERFLEVLDIIEMAFAEGRVAYQGRHFRIPETALSIRPLRAEGPPIYLAGLAEDEEVARRMAERGYIPFASAAWQPVPAVAKKRAGYEAGYRAAGCDPGTMPFAVQRLIYVTDDRAEARRAAEAARYTYRLVTSVKGASPEFDGAFIRERPMSGEDELEAILEAAMIGDAEKCAERIVADVEALGLTHLSCFMNFGGMPSAGVRRSMERFARDVRPLVERALAGRAPHRARRLGAESG